MLNEHGEWDHYEISVKRLDGESMTLKVCGESSITDMKEKFQLILKWMTFADSTINEIFVNEEDDYEESKEEDNKVDESGRDDTQHKGHDHKTRSKRNHTIKQHSKKER